MLRAPAEGKQTGAFGVQKWVLMAGGGFFSDSRLPVSVGLLGKRRR